MGVWRGWNSYTTDQAGSKGRIWRPHERLKLASCSLPSRPRLSCPPARLSATSQSTCREGLERDQASRSSLGARDCGGPPPSFKLPSPRPSTLRIAPAVQPSGAPDVLNRSVGDLHRLFVAVGHEQASSVGSTSYVCQSVSSPRRLSRPHALHCSLALLTTFHTCAPMYRPWRQVWPLCPRNRDRVRPVFFGLFPTSTLRWRSSSSPSLKTGHVDRFSFTHPRRVRCYHDSSRNALGARGRRDWRQDAPRIQERAEELEGALDCLQGKSL